MFALYIFSALLTHWAGFAMVAAVSSDGSESSAHGSITASGDVCDAVGTHANARACSVSAAFALMSHRLSTSVKVIHVYAHARGYSNVRDVEE